MKKTTKNSFLLREQDEDTICALATPPGEGAISLIRVSGKKAFEISRKLCPFLPSKIKSHSIYFGTLVHPETKKALDEVLVFCFEKGRSFTGEESFEISFHGSSFIAEALLEALRVGGARLAEKGEFSYRAFMNGKMDLIQAESVLGLIQSRTPKAHVQALKGLKGGNSLRLKTLEEKLLKLISHLSASIDFSDQEIEPFSRKQQKILLKEIKQEIILTLKSFEQGRINKEGFSVLLSGAPNAGKSSLFNCLLEEEKAIVTEEPGTTRDILSARILLNQREFCLKDTAGFRKNPDSVEKKGIEKALEEIKHADICLFLVESLLPLNPESFFGLQKMDPGKTFMVFSKSDKLSLRERDKLLQIATSFLKENFQKSTAESSVFSTYQPKFKEVLWLSSHTGEGVSVLKEFLHKKSEKGAFDSFLFTPRQGTALKKIKHFLELAEKLLEQNASPEFTIFELQSALSVLYKLSGKEYNEDVIKQVFKEFCIGK